MFSSSFVILMNNIDIGDIYLDRTTMTMMIYCRLKLMEGDRRNTISVVFEGKRDKRLIIRHWMSDNEI